VDDPATYSWNDLIAALGQPHYGGPFAEPVSRTAGEAAYVPGSIEDAAYDESAENEWIAWRCAEPTTERCIAVICNQERGRWTRVHRCALHRSI
jgi:hypothetical protein